MRKCSCVSLSLALLFASSVAVLANNSTNQTVPKLPVGGGRIVGGVDAEIEDFLYQVSLQYQGNHFCGGSIIAPEWVLTASHCLVYPPASIKVRAGSTYTASGGTVHDVVEAITHNAYNPTNFNNDVGLLKVSPAFDNIAMSRIELSNQQVIQPNMSVTVSGWGLTKEGGTAPSRLLAINILTIKQTRCKGYYKGALISPYMFCAGEIEGTKDSCQGDSGGPLVGTFNGKRKQIGVVSWGYGCARPNYPGVYTSVPKLIKWIIKTTNKAVAI